MIKKTFFLFALVLGVIACDKPADSYTINGVVEGLNEGDVVYLYDNNEKKDVDSVAVTNNTFTLTGSVEEASFFYLLVRRGEDDVFYRGFWIENSEITVEGSLSNFAQAKVAGSKMQEQQNEYEESVAFLTVQFDSLYALFDADNKELADELEEQIDSLMEIETQQKVTFVKANPDYDFSAFLSKRLVRNVSPEEGMQVYEALSDRQKQSKYGVVTKEFLDLNKNLAVGDSYVELSLPNTQGEMQNLSAFNGKYVLIDFWASWCNPCRHESPYLRDAYAKYKDKGFEIYAVSLDKDVDKWVEAIAADSMTWTTVLADGAFDSKSAMMYGVKYIPYNYLINPEGEIVEMHLRGEALIEKLDELLQ